MTKPRIDHIDRDKLKTDEDRAVYDMLALAVENGEGPSLGEGVLTEGEGAASILHRHLCPGANDRARLTDRSTGREVQPLRQNKLRPSE